MSTERVIHEIQQERNRQQTDERFTCAHDDEHDGGEIAAAGAAYALCAAAMLSPYDGIPHDDPPDCWPWSRDWWKPKTPRRDLIRAAALIVAEIERLDRLAVPQ